ncbi:MAG: 4-hydroxythreonine-4-phosphate dehydrogenase PdxA, partial [Pirellulales bacterium]|nr:4-hydroxythreonine-4-phosphate dehydrogenase PdxA [Pirellulales bacterium]
VDHGTAFDIAWTGKAAHESLLHAVRLAALLAGRTKSV